MTSPLFGQNLLQVSGRMPVAAVSEICKRQPPRLVGSASKISDQGPSHDIGNGDLPSACLALERPGEIVGQQNRGALHVNIISPQGSDRREA